MSIVFDKFPSIDDATRFASAVQTKTGLASRVYRDLNQPADDEDFHEHLACFEIYPPAVFVERADCCSGDEAHFKAECSRERVARDLVQDFGGEFSFT